MNARSIMFESMEIIATLYGKDHWHMVEKT